MTDLAATWLKLPGVDPVQLSEHGVGFRQSQMVGGVRQGKRGWILPCYIDPPSIYRDVPEPILEDLVIFDPARPSRWRTLYGAGAFLGEAAFDEARVYRLPLPVFRTPLNWLQAGGGGVFPLDPIRFGIAVVGYPALRLIGEDLEHGRELQRLVERIPRLGLPKIGVRRTAA